MIPITTLIIFLIIMAAAGELSIQIVTSELSFFLKSHLGLTQPYPNQLIALSKFKFYKKLIGWLSYILFPVIIIIIIGINIHKFFAGLFNCPYCVGFHIGWIVNFFWLGMTLSQALFLAPIVLIFVRILDRISR